MASEGWNKQQTFHMRRSLHWRMSVFNYGNGRSCHHVVVWVQCPTFPSLNCIFVFHQTQMLTPPHEQFKAIQCNMVVLLLKHMNKWESTLHIDGYYIMGVTAILFHVFKCIIIIISKEEKTYLVFITNNLQRTCLNFAKHFIKGSGEEGSVGIMQTFALHYDVFTQG